DLPGRVLHARDPLRAGSTRTARQRIAQPACNLANRNLGRDLAGSIRAKDRRAKARPPAHAVDSGANIVRFGRQGANPRVRVDLHAHDSLGQATECITCAARRASNRAWSSDASCARLGQAATSAATITATTRSMHTTAHCRSTTNPKPSGSGIDT